MGLHLQGLPMTYEEEVMTASCQGHIQTLPVCCKGGWAGDGCAEDDEVLLHAL